MTSAQTPPSFGALGVPDDLTDALAAAHIDTPTPIQAATLPDSLAGRDVAAQAPTGSGKTIAFGLPLAARLDRGQSKRPRGLILAPTRELAEQIRGALDPLLRVKGRRVLAVYGGVAVGPQRKALAKGIDLLVATPGRLQDLIDQGAVSLGAVDMVAVDEADRMADMGFLPAVNALLDSTASERQTLLFSATLDGDVQALVKRHLRDHQRHEVGGTEPDLSRVTHRFYATRKEQKLGLTADLIDENGTTIVFCRTRHGVDRVARQLKNLGVRSGWIHGGRSQAQRDAALHSFTTGRVAALVATDVAARGLHIDDVACVIHFDPPADHKDYVHRSGRTARAGAGGLVVSLVNNDQQKAVARLQRDVGLPTDPPDPAPELTEREAPAWVDRRPERTSASARSAGPKPKARAGGDRDDQVRRDDRPPRRTRGDRDDRRGRNERPNRRDRGERRDRNDRNDRPHRDDRGERRDRTERPTRSERPDRSERGDRTERGERAERPGRTERGAGRGERGADRTRSERPGRSEQAGRRQRGERPRRAERDERTDRSDRPSHAARGGRQDRPGRRDRRDAGERPSAGAHRPGSGRPDLDGDGRAPHDPTEGRSSGKAKAKPKPKPAKKGKTTKRSGRARTKDHKQTRRRAR
ncbi:MAG: DEAD/DEAH box helicase [Actinomycetota bacterium]